MKANQKKGVMGQILSIFIIILIVSILSGLTFLFVASLKNNVISSSAISDTITVTNESKNTVTGAAQNLAAYSLRNSLCTVNTVINASGGEDIAHGGNWTGGNCQIASVSGSPYNNTNWKISYSYTYLPVSTAENAVNTTEAAGTTVVNYLPLIFLALIFAVILTIVLRLIIPYVNLGNQMGGI